MFHLKSYMKHILIVEKEKQVLKYIYKINNKKYSETMFEERKLLFKEKHEIKRNYKSSS